MDIPDLTRVICVVAASPLAEAHEIIAAGQVLFVGDDDIQFETLREQVLKLATEGAYAFAERRNHDFWGERGNDSAEIFCTLADDHPLTVPRFVDGLRGLVPDSFNDQMLGEMAPPTDEGAAWEQFAEFVERATRATRLRATTVDEVADGWAIRALGRSGYGYSGWISADGRAAQVERNPFGLPLG
ncbi:MAG: hypothetical protein ACOYNI_00785 [Acidimicrobiia bacterium]